MSQPIPNKGRKPYSLPCKRGTSFSEADADVLDRIAQAGGWSRSAALRELALAGVAPVKARLRSQRTSARGRKTA